jgi:hypothetical protein
MHGGTSNDDTAHSGMFEDTDNERTDSRTDAASS